MAEAIAKDGPTEEEPSVPLRPWMRFGHLYYVVNAAMVLGYGVLRLYFSSPRLVTTQTWTGQSQEMEVLGLAAASLLSKYRKIATFDELLDKLFFHGKSSVAILLFFVGVPHSVSYILIWTVVALVVQYPHFALPTEVKALSPGDFQSMVRSSAVNATGPQVAWLVMFHADWCSGSNTIQPMFGALARRHASKNRRFGRVDVVAYPEVAEDLNIDTGGTSKQLPTLALFACGREVCRLPTFASDGRVVRARLDERGVTKYFELDKDFKATSYARKSKGRGKS
eukprot:jgi/Undpi1/13295/HiC_scaffold_8.g02957.m1